MDFKLVIYLLCQIRRGLHLRPAEIAFPVSLTGQIAQIDDVKIYQLEPGNTHGSQLQGHLPAYGADTDDRRLARSQSFGRDNIPLATVAFFYLFLIHNW
jgi:hypothetical protein